MKRYYRKIEKDVELTMNELDHLEKVEASPFFYSKLTERLKQESSIKRSFFTIVFNHPILRPALLTLIIAINLFTVIKLINNGNIESNDQENPFDSIAQSYASTSDVESIYYLNEE